MNCEKGYKDSCLKACKEVSTWTNLCENKSIQLYSKAQMTKFEDEKALEQLKTEFIDIIENKLKNPLCLANRKEFKNSSLKYLEDVNMNISDLLVYFILNLMIDSSNHALLNKYKSIENWYLNTMPQNADLSKFEEILNCYKNFKVISSKMKAFDFDQIKISLNELTVSSSSEIKDFDLNIEMLKIFIEDNFQVTVPLEVNRFYTEQDIKLDWKSINQQLNPQAG